MDKIKILQDTVFKLEPRQAKELSKDQQVSIKAGNIVEADISSKLYPGKHLRLKLKEPLTFGDKQHYVVYVYKGHVEIEGGNLPLEDKVRLNIPYKSQTDNEFNPGGSCNVTSIAMCLEFFKAQRRTSVGQFEDEIYDYAINMGYSRHSPGDLAQVVRDYGCRDKFIENGTIEGVKRWLAEGKPVVTHGYFTSFGHIIVLVGYDQNGFIVHDPYGEWFSWGYDRNDERNNEKGKYLHYSFGLIERTCMPDGDFWVHFISK